MEYIIDFLNTEYSIYEWFIGSIITLSIFLVAIKANYDFYRWLKQLRNEHPESIDSSKRAAFKIFFWGGR